MSVPIEVCGSNLGVLWGDDPRSVVFRMARYQFVAKMLAGMNTVLEVGAGCGTLARLVEQTVGRVVRTDREPQADGVWPWDPAARCTGLITVTAPYDAAYALDVLEHVPAAEEDAFLAGIAAVLRPEGTLVIGMPSLESQAYASANSRAGHVNCKTEAGLRETLRRHFRCVYLFGMNDATLHAGFGPMCHYRFAVCNTVRP